MNRKIEKTRASEFAQGGPVRAMSTNGSFSNGAAAGVKNQGRSYAEAIVETIRSSLLLLDTSLRVKMANRTFYEMFKVTRQETQDRHIWDLGAGEWNIPRLRFMLESLVTNIKEFKNFEVERSFPGIGFRTMLLNGSRIAQGDHGTDLVLIAIEDVTEHKHVEEELSESEERFRQLAENIKVAFWMTDPQRKKIIYISPAYESIWGRSCDALYIEPNSWYDAIHPEDRARVMKSLVSKPARGRYKEEYRIIRPDGSFRWIRDSAFPVRDEQGRVYRVAGIAEDITELKRVENLILEISGREQRRIGQDMHDGLCQVLTGVKFMSKGLEDKLAKKNMAESSDAAEISRLVSQALSHADVIAKGLCPVELEENGTIAGLRQLAVGLNKLHGVNCTMTADDAVEIQDDFVATHLYRIAQEAVGNAVKHGKAKNIRIEISAAGDDVTLAVRDDGVGFPKVVKRKGMGMHIMRFRANKIGGAFAVQRIPSGGTAVVCTFKNIQRNSSFGRRRDDKISN